MLLIVVVAISAVVAGFALLGGQAPAVTSQANQDGSEVYSVLASLPQSELDAIGTGGVTSPLKVITGAPAPARPQMFYLGAEYCPYCAGERWSLVQALSRFGTFSKLSLTTSSSTDKYPNTSSFSFLGSTYSSQWIDLVTVENRDREGHPLQPIPANLSPLVNRYDPGGPIPFLYIGGHYTTLGANYQIDVLKGLGWSDIAHALQNPSSPAAAPIIGNANYLTAAMCETTGGQPAAVCSTDAVRKVSLPPR